MIFWGLMFLIFIISLPILCVSIIFLMAFIKKRKSKEKYHKILFAFTIIGTVIGFVLFSVPVGFTLFLRTMNNSMKVDNVNTGLTIYWETDQNGNDHFVINNRKYRYLIIENSQNSTSIEIDRAIANIIPQNYNEMRLLRFIFGGDNKETLYAIKNCPDQSILTTGGYSDTGDNSVYFSLYCDESLIDIKKEYYNDLNNYVYYFSEEEFGNEEQNIAILPVKYQKVNDLYHYKGVEIDIPDKEYEYINIYGISNDKMIHKFIAVIIIDGDNFYREESSRMDTIHVTILPDDHKEFIWSLIKQD